MAKNTFAKDPRRGDDRNLVIVDQDFGQPDLEDRMWLFWVRNKVAILGVIALVVLGALGWICWKAYKDYSVAALKEEFQNVGEKPADKLFFARRNAGTAIAGTAAIEAGDVFYKEKNYTSAASAYAEARKNFRLEDKFEAAIAGRAHLGEAFSYVYAGEAEKGVATFSELSKIAAYPAAERGQAMYNLALLALEKKDVAGARAWIDSMGRELGGNNPWLVKVQQLLTSEPELSNTGAAAANVGLPITAEPVKSPETPAAKP